MMQKIEMPLVRDTLPKELTQFILSQPNNATFFLVGGAVRDMVMGLPIDLISDLDFEVFGVDSFDKLTEMLMPLGRVDIVGKAHGVAKVHTEWGLFDFNLPRTEKHLSGKHNDIEIVIGPNMSTWEASLRRDFTMNALMVNVRDTILFDMHNGLEHIENRMLHPVSEQFKEDALRVLRGMQFASRFNMWASPKTVAFAIEMLGQFSALPVDRIQQEWIKWAKGKHPDTGLRFLQATWISCFPELAALQGVPQDPIWHPEGDVWEHTIQTVAAMSKLFEQEPAENEDEHVEQIFGALAHDLGKPETTIFDGRWRSPSHAKAGIAPAESLGKRIFLVDGQKELPNVVKSMMDAAEFHMRFSNLDEVTRRSVRRVATCLRRMTLGQLRKLIISDTAGRPFTGQFIMQLHHVDKMLKIAESMNAVSEMPKGIIRGTHLIAHGLMPGPIFGRIILAAENAQFVDEVFWDEATAKDWLNENLFNLVAKYE